MQAFELLEWRATLDTLLSLSVAFLLGSLIGFERQYRQRTAGLRTNTLVAIGAAVFVDMAMRLYGDDGASRVVAYVVSGVGFLGAGVIMREGGSVRGINTAATIWGSAAVGACAGANLLVEATLAALFVIAANTTLRPVVNRINRQPVVGESSEVTYEIILIVDRQQQRFAREQLKRQLQAASIPVHELEIEPFGESEVEITARIMPSSMEAGELDRILLAINSHIGPNQAFWTYNTTD